MRRAWFICLVGVATGCGELLGVDGLHDRIDTGVDASDTPDASDASDLDVFDGCALALTTNSCAAFPQCGCDGGLNCVVTDLKGKTSCLVSGPTALYRLCTTNICGLGAACIGGVCKPYCDTDNDCPRFDGGARRACLQITTTGLPTGTPIPGLKMCSAGCDFLAPGTLCGPNVQCEPQLDDNDNVTPDCVGPAGTAMGPGTCTSKQLTQCAPGYACCDESGPNPLACSKYCRTSQAATDCGSLACVTFSPPIIVDGIEYGSCN